MGYGAGVASSLPIIHGRGAGDNPKNRFATLTIIEDLEQADPDDERLDPGRRLKTELFVDSTQTVLNHNDSPDIPFELALNPYRGCEHGCTYCFARPFHEYLGFSAGLDFETKIVVKPDAPELLRRELSAKKYVPKSIAFSGITDVYQPIERTLKLSRRCLLVLAEFRNPVAIITKSALVRRDLDLLAELARFNAVRVDISVTSLDAKISAAMEPRASSPQRQLEAIVACAAAGVPVGIIVAPVVPGLTDHELPAILAAGAAAGARWAAYTPLRLPGAVATVFSEWLRRTFPDRADRVLSRIRALRDGRLNDPAFGSRMNGTGDFANTLGNLFEIHRRRYGLDHHGPTLDKSHFRVPGGQMTLF